MPSILSVRGERAIGGLHCVILYDDNVILKELHDDVAGGSQMVV